MSSGPPKHVLQRECICGKPVTGTSQYFMEYRDRSFHFCSVECMRDFEERPWAFA